MIANQPAAHQECCKTLLSPAQLFNIQVELWAAAARRGGTISHLLSPSLKSNATSINKSLTHMEKRRATRVEEVLPAETMPKLEPLAPPPPAAATRPGPATRALLM